MSQNTAQGLSAEAPRTSRPRPKLNSSPRPQPRRRRRPWVFALCAALVAAGALGTAFAFTSVNDTQEVLVVSRDIERGETIEAGDLSVVRVSVDPALTRYAITDDDVDRLRLAYLQDPRSVPPVDPRKYEGPRSKAQYYAHLAREKWEKRLARATFGKV